MEQNRRSPHILVVEDDPLVREMIVDILREAGFAAHEAGCADEALRDLAEQPGISAVVTDIDMPGTLDGIELSWRIEELWPRIGVIVISGGTRAAQLPRAAQFLAKPFTAGRLLSSLTDLTGKPSMAYTPS
jgi:two-component system, response regulator PdtaR